MNPYTDNPRISILRSLEEECAARYAQSSEEIERLILENRIFRAQRNALRDIADKSAELFEMQADIAHVQQLAEKEATIRRMAGSIRNILQNTQEPI